MTSVNSAPLGSLQQRVLRYLESAEFEETVYEIAFEVLYDGEQPAGPDDLRSMRDCLYRLRRRGLVAGRKT